MKLYISADMEGITGVTNWDEVNKSMPDYKIFSNQMTNEVKAACDGINEAEIQVSTNSDCFNMKEIVVNDAHDSARNIDVLKLPKNIEIIRGWSIEPLCMFQGLDESFDAVIMIGYHSPSNSDGNPLSHTLSSNKITSIKFNGSIASEFLVGAYTAAYFNIPVLFVSGDETLCKEVKELNVNIKTVSVMRGVGASTVSIHPCVAIERIKNSVKESLMQNIRMCKIELPKEFIVEVQYKNHKDAYKSSYYPGVEKIDSHTLLFKTDDFYEVLRTLFFVI